MSKRISFTGSYKKGEAAISQLTLAILLLFASWESSSKP